MASLNGVSIKNLKDFEGREGTGSQATVYLNGTKIGFWSDSANGGCHDYDFNVDLLKDAVYKMKSSLGGEIIQYYDVDLFMMDVVALTLLEKEYKRLTKKGFPVLLGAIAWGGSCAIDRIGYNIGNGAVLTSKGPVFEAEKQRLLNKNNLNSYAHGNEIFVNVFKSIDDFNIIQGTDDGLQIEKSKQLQKEKENKKKYLEDEKRRKAEEKKLKNNGRFTSESLGNQMKIVDVTTNKFTIVPVFAYKETMKALMELFL